MDILVLSTFFRRSFPPEHLGNVLVDIVDLSVVEGIFCVVGYMKEVFFFWIFLFIYLFIVVWSERIEINV